MNAHPKPREDNVREYLKFLQRRNTQREQEQFADKGRNTLLDSYTKKELRRFATRSELRTSHHQNATFVRWSISFWELHAHSWWG
jgi:hypothetical protein